MDGFGDSQLFDDDAPWPAPQGDEATDPLTVSGENRSPRLYREVALRRLVYVVAALAMLVTVVVALRAERPLPGRPHHDTPDSHHVRQRTAGRRKPIRTRRRATARRADTEASPPSVVVELPSSGPVRPSGGEDVGIGRPTPAPQVGNTEQFGYLGK
jgi:hypothetical protein